MIEVFDRAGIQKIIPHREPFLYIDEVEAEGVFVKGKSNQLDKLLTVKWIGSRRGPNPLIIEALAEVGAVGLLNQEENKGKLALLTGLRRWKFRAVEPSGPIDLEVELIRARSKLVQAMCKASVSGQLLASGELSCGIIDKK